jgi:hypothetical protein
MKARLGGPDAKRVGKAVSFPGIDPRTWVATARVETDPDSLRWHPELGWVVDVAIYGGDLQGTTDVVCRVTTPLGGPGAGVFMPPQLDAEALIAFPSGDPEMNPVLVGWLNSQGENAAPTEVNGLPIDGSADSSTPASVSPFDTEISVSPHGMRSQRDGLEHRQAAQHILAGDDSKDAVLLGSEDAKHPFVKGDALGEQLVQLIDPMVAILVKVGAALSVLDSSVAGDVTKLKTLWESVVKLSLTIEGGPVLSDRVKGE